MILIPLMSLLLLLIILMVLPGILPAVNFYELQDRDRMIIYSLYKKKHSSTEYSWFLFPDFWKGFVIEVFVICTHYSGMLYQGEQVD